MARRERTRRLNSEDLPTLGRPTRATVRGRRVKPDRRGGSAGAPEAAPAAAAAARSLFFVGEEEKGRSAAADGKTDREGRARSAVLQHKQHPRGAWRSAAVSMARGVRSECAVAETLELRQWCTPAGSRKREKL